MQGLHQGFALQHLNVVRLFLFDCCQSNGGVVPYKGSEVITREKVFIVPTEAVGFAIKGGGDSENRGLWTRILCENLLKVDKSL